MNANAQTQPVAMVAPLPNQHTLQTLIAKATELGEQADGLVPYNAGRARNFWNHMMREAACVIGVGVFGCVFRKPDCVLKLHCTFMLALAQLFPEQF